MCHVTQKVWEKGCDSLSLLTCGLSLLPVRCSCLEPPWSPLPRPFPSFLPHTPSFSSACCEMGCSALGPLLDCAHSLESSSVHCLHLRVDRNQSSSSELSHLCLLSAFFVPDRAHFCPSLLQEAPGPEDRSLAISSI